MHYVLIVWVAINTPDSIPNGRLVSKTEYPSESACQKAMKLEKSSNKQCIPLTPNISKWMKKG